jgi:AhpD family alkylhydroperoxidase
MYDIENLKKLPALGKLAPESMAAFQALDSAALADGAIPKKYKELMALAVALNTQCPYCLYVHREAAYHLRYCCHRLPGIKLRLHVERSLKISPRKQAMSRLIPLFAASLLCGLSATAYASSFKTLYRFTGKSDGGNPMGGVIEDSSGTIYGETYQGGTYTCPNPPDNKQGCGTVYSLSKSGGLRLLVSFTGANGGHGNVAPVLVGTTLYGAAAAGGTSNDGVIFSVNTDGTNFALLHEFSGTDGTNPDALVADSSGTLYGITETGGPNNDGVLFSLSRAGTYTVLHNFTLPTSGYPNTLIIAQSGTLVGSSFYGGSQSSGCLQGCGTVFTYDLATRKLITAFTLPSSGSDGFSPYLGSFGPGNTIYGANAVTSIFSLGRRSGFTPLADQNYYSVGSEANSGPAYAPSGILYGVLYTGVLSGYGSIYSLQNGVIQDVYIFDGGRNGGGPMAKPFVTFSGSILGTTISSNCNYCGTIWDYTP